MATSGPGSGMVGYNVQAAVDTANHLIVAHEVTNVGTDKSHLANIANQAKAALEAENLEAFADRGYFKGEEILLTSMASTIAEGFEELRSNLEITDLQEETVSTRQQNVRKALEDDLTT